MSKTQEMCNSFKSFKAVASMWLWPAWYQSVNHNETGNNLIAGVAIQLAKIWLEFWLEKRLEIPF